MANEVTILFQHHKTDSLTMRRFANLAQLNPGVPIVPLTQKSTDVLPGTFDSASIAGWENEKVWHGSDLAIYFWFLHGRTSENSAERYVYVEYDMLFRVPVREFYREVWDDDVASAQVFHIGPHRHWNWFRTEFSKIPVEMRTRAAGVVPLCGVLLSHRALAAIAASNIPHHVFCECRLGTLANMNGFDLVEFPWTKKRNITWREDFVRLDIDSQAYHPLKQLTPWDEL